MTDPKEALDKLTDRILAYRPIKVKGSLLKKVGVSSKRKDNKPLKDAKKKKSKTD